MPCVDFSVQWLLWLQSTGSRTRASAVVAPGLGCSKACGIFPDQGSNLCFLHWQVDSLPQRKALLCQFLVGPFIYLVCAESSLPCTGFSHCGEWARQLQHSGLIAPRHVGSQFSDQRSKPTSPVLQGRFLTTWPPGKSLIGQF